jgi:hypothetical protein
MFLNDYFTEVVDIRRDLYYVAAEFFSGTDCGK